ncbi:hypothetical protein [Apis mellifera associated microvirus 51]|nr:hypothetical protein [Apis mellifera associated microvirus 51]
MSKLDEKGHEVLDSKPVEAPVKWRRPPTIQEMISNAIRSGELARFAEQQGHETPEEADDFDVGDDYDPSSPYEEHFDHIQNFEALRHQVKENKKRRYATEEVPKKKAKKEPKEDDSEAET